MLGPRLISLLVVHHFGENDFGACHFRGPGRRPTSGFPWSERLPSV